MQEKNDEKRNPLTDSGADTTVTQLLRAPLPTSSGSSSTPDVDPSPISSFSSFLPTPHQNSIQHSQIPLIPVSDSSDLSTGTEHSNATLSMPQTSISTPDAAVTVTLTNNDQEKTIAPPLSPHFSLPPISSAPSEALIRAINITLLDNQLIAINPSLAPTTPVHVEALAQSASSDADTTDGKNAPPINVCNVHETFCFFGLFMSEPA